MRVRGYGAFDAGVLNPFKKITQQVTARAGQAILQGNTGIVPPVPASPAGGKQICLGGACVGLPSIPGARGPVVVAPPSTTASPTPQIMDAIRGVAIPGSPGTSMLTTIPVAGTVPVTLSEEMLNASGQAPASSGSTPVISLPPATSTNVGSPVATFAPIPTTTAENAGIVPPTEPSSLPAWALPAGLGLLGVGAFWYMQRQGHGSMAGLRRSRRR